MITDKKMKKIIDKAYKTEMENIRIFSVVNELENIFHYLIFNNKDLTIDELKGKIKAACTSEHEIINHFGSPYIKFIFSENENENIYIKLDGKLSVYETKEVTADEIRIVLKNRINELISEIKKRNTQLINLNKKLLEMR